MQLYQKGMHCIQQWGMTNSTLEKCKTLDKLPVSLGISKWSLLLADVWGEERSRECQMEEIGSSVHHCCWIHPSHLLLTPVSPTQSLPQTSHSFPSAAPQPPLLWLTGCGKVWQRTCRAVACCCSMSQTVTNWVRRLRTVNCLLKQRPSLPLM